MPEVTNRGRWALGAGLLVACAMAVGWLALPSTPAPGEAGVVRLADGAAPPVAVAPPTPAVVAEPTPLTPQRNSEQADEDHYLVLREARDQAWADRSEAAIRTLMHGLAYVDRASLKIRCTTTVCEASGLAIEDSASGSMVPVWEAFGREDGLAGLEISAAIFGTGRVREEFVIHYRRIEARKP